METLPENASTYHSGDFLFYSLVMVQASVQGCMLSIMSTLLTILFGLLLTLVILVLKKRALPALPISISLGVIVFFATEYLARDFGLALNRNAVFI